MSYQNEIKSIKLLQDKAEEVNEKHKKISNDLDEIKSLLSTFDTSEYLEDIESAKKKNIFDMSKEKPLRSKKISEIYKEANCKYNQDLDINDILTKEDLLKCESKYNKYLEDFNKKYALDKWDYAIATSCGLFAAILDILFVSAPPKPTEAYNKKVDGIFNEWVQKAFNKVIPPELSETLSKECKIGSADASINKVLKTDQEKVLNPYNHRLKGLAHDPIIGVIIGVLDMRNGTCTVVHNGKIQILETIRDKMDDENIFYQIGKMLGHLLSDINAPSASGNRGMGLPAPFMGLLRMFDSIEVSKEFGLEETSTFGKQIEWMYTNGYDFRQFMATSIPMAIMEVLLRVFYTVKQVKLNNAEFGKTILETMPLNLNPRFRMMLAIAYGTSSAINTGKVYVTKNLLNTNYASWMGLAWNSFHSLKWLLYEKHEKLHELITDNEIKELKEITSKLEELENKIKMLPI